MMTGAVCISPLVLRTPIGLLFQALIPLVPNNLSDRRETSRNANLSIKHYIYTVLGQKSVPHGENLLFNSLNYSAAYSLLTYCHVYDGTRDDNDGL
jgi:hypothetical protein